MRRTILASVLCVLLAVVARGESPASAYGSKIAFTAGTKLVFPDFALEVVGSRKSAAAKGKRSILRHEFVVTTPAGEKKSVSWASGPGDVGPAIFTVSHKKFWIELSRSESLGKLKPNELVVTSRGPST